MMTEENSLSHLPVAMTTTAMPGVETTGEMPPSSSYRADFYF